MAPKQLQRAHHQHVVSCVNRVNTLIFHVHSFAKYIFPYRCCSIS